MPAPSYTIDVDNKLISFQVYGWLTSWPNLNLVYFVFLEVIINLPKTRMVDPSLH